MRRAGLVPFVCALLALATTGVAVAASLHAKDWDVTALVRMSRDEPMAPIALAHDKGFDLGPVTSHYDGVYFYAIALDPLGRGEPARALNNKTHRGPYRYGHPGYGWMSRAASAGNPRAVPGAMLVLALVGVVVGAWAASSLARALGFTPWAGLAVAFNPGIVYAATVLTSETVGVALLMGGLLAWVRGRRVLGALVFAAACLTKEPFLLVPVGLGLWELIDGVRTRGPVWLRSAELWRRAGLLLIGPLAFGAWYLYLIVQFDVAPHTLVQDLTSWPFYAWWRSFRLAGQVGLGDFTFDQVQIATASMALLAVAGVMLAAGVLAAMRWRTPVAGVSIGLALIAFSLLELGVYYPKDLIREISMPAALLPFVFAPRRPEAAIAPEPEPVGEQEPDPLETLGWEPAEPVAEPEG